MKNKSLILLAGPPATGKTYLTDKINKIIPSLEIITPDEIKEILADNEGFDDLNEKNELEKKVWFIYYYLLEYLMITNKQTILTEYPFSDKQKPILKELSEKHGYSVITVRLIANFDVLWSRRKARDRTSDRHLSHIMKSYHFGDTLLDRNKATNLITKKQFKKIINDREYNKFKLGKLFEFDVTEYSKLDYTPIIQFLKQI